MPAGTPLWSKKKKNPEKKNGLLRRVPPDFLFIQMEIVASSNSFRLLQLTKNQLSKKFWPLHL